MPTPHTLPIVQFSTVTLRPVIWWGTQKEPSHAPPDRKNNNGNSHKSIVVEEVMQAFAQAERLEDTVKKAFKEWIRKQVIAKPVESHAMYSFCGCCCCAGVAVVVVASSVVVVGAVTFTIAVAVVVVQVVIVAVHCHNLLMVVG